MKRLLWRTGLLGVVLVAALLTYLTFRVRHQSTLDEARSADLIVVLGAAEYAGRPSPVFKARLDHALDLYRRGLAPRILTTGGAGGDPVFTEGGVGRSYLISQKVPAEAILVEPEGAHTAHSLAATVEIMNTLRLRSCIVVSDGYHIYRAKVMLESHGLDVHGSPRPSEAPDNWWIYLREAASLMLWLIGLR
ncbi:MAG: YdcF family protein [Bryobacterales bacterium]|nr:YdcF family protein [Bryobacterales bacterium]